ncbi:hypothetical protein [Rhizomonospora bruguierae]|uniref:hypothetical protein n=1 Tax=Rhizomonospora bruguierae TaxID=1581705 RepID=UPI001BCF1E4C|nr:hypothetical protein [Micromonospora sp. NBRC 107566]
MAFGFVLAILAALCSASAAILQSIGARRLAATRHPDPRLLLRLVRNGPYAGGLALDASSSVLSYTALRTIPLFAVQAVGAANLSIVAVVAMFVLGVRLRVWDWLAIGSIVAGLLMLLFSAVAGPPSTVSRLADWALLVAVVALLAGGNLGAPRLRGPALPGLLAGLSFGSAALGARLIGRSGTVLALVANPATYAVLLAGLNGVLMYALALQRGSVTVASASSIVGQTVAPALVGLLVLHDRVRPGFAPIAGVGFVFAVAGAIALARHAKPQAPRTVEEESLAGGGRRH